MTFAFPAAPIIVDVPSWPSPRPVPPDVGLDIFAGRELRFDVQFRWRQQILLGSGWTLRLTIRRTIDGTALINVTSAGAALSWVSARSAWRVLLTGTQTASLAPVSYPSLRPHRFETMIYDLEVTPDAWVIPTPPRAFLALGGQCRVFRDLSPTPPPE